MQKEGISEICLEAQLYIALNLLVFTKNFSLPKCNLNHLILEDGLEEVEP
jgi:hypothetical protein